MKPQGREGCSLWLSKHSLQSSGSLTEDSALLNMTAKESKDSSFSTKMWS